MNLSILNLASALAAHASARQEVIAENVAHADTPGYRARDVADFAAILDGGPAFSARMTRPGHIAFGATRTASSRARRRPSGRRRRTATRSRSRTR